jgi:hypothetical protein
MSTATFVAMERQSTLWGIHAQIVQAIVADREWDGPAPLDMAEALGFATLASDVGRPVLLIGAAESTAAIRALGVVGLRQVEVSCVLPIPHLARHPDKRQTVSGVAFIDGGRPLLVLDPIALLAMAEEHGKP